MALIGSLGANIEIMQQVRRINNQLNSIAERAKGPVRNVLLASANSMADEMRQIVKVDPTSKTPGAARDSIRVEEGESTSKKDVVVKIKAGDTKTHGDETADHHGFNYVRGLEFGTIHMNAEPFFYPVYRARKKAARAACNRIVKEEVQRLFQ